MCCCMIKTSFVPPGKSSVIFRNLWKMFGKMFAKCSETSSSSLRINFGKPSESGRKSQENCQKSVFISVFFSLQLELNTQTQKSIHIHTRACNIICMYNWQEVSPLWTLYSLDIKTNVEGITVLKFLHFYSQDSNQNHRNYQVTVSLSLAQVSSKLFCDELSISVVT